MGALQILQERNPRAARPFAARGAPWLCVVTCDDAALTAQLEPCLGLGPGEAVVIRLPAGGGGLSQEVVQRAVAKAVLVEGCAEVLLLTHSSCTLYNLSATTLIEGLARAKIPRSAVPYDLRELVGAGRDPRQSATESAAALRQCPFLPPSLLVHVGHLDEATGQLLLVEDGQGRQLPRPEDTASHIAGYQPGPAVHAELQLPATALPPLSFPEQPPIAVELPSLSVSLPSEVAIPLQPSPVQLEPSAPAAPPPIVQLPTRPSAQAQPPAPNAPAAGQRKDKVAPPSPTRRTNTTLDPELAEALEKVRTVITSHVGRNDRRKAAMELAEAARQDRPMDEQIKLAFQPIMQAGEARYRVIDEMLLIKDALGRLPATKATDLLIELLR